MQSSNSWPASSGTTVAFGVEDSAIAVLAIEAESELVELLMPLQFCSLLVGGYSEVHVLVAAFLRGTALSFIRYCRI